MDALGSYGNLVVPVVIALVLIVAFFKIAIALEHAVVKIATSLLTIIVLGVVLIFGIQMLGRINTVRNVASTAVQDVTASTAAGKATTAAALTQSLDTSARKALADVGLDPAYLSLHVTCDAPQAHVHVSYQDQKFLFGTLSHQDFSLPWPNPVRC
jgi:hypothetical protein